MKTFDKGSRVVFAFSDTAGANACLSQAFIASREDGCDIVCITNNSGLQTTNWPLPVLVKESPEESDIQFADVLFTGTSHPDSSSRFELQTIRLAQAKNIYTIAYVDHWTNLKMRFEADGKFIFPDEIWLPDQTAFELAVKEGISKSLLLIKKNPYHIYLSEFWKSAYSFKGYAKKLGLSVDKKIVVIAPDPVSLRNDLKFGFTEISALEDLLSAINELPISVEVVIKTHALQPLRLLSPVIDKYLLQGLSAKLLTQADNPELIHTADLVVGFYSNFLLEAHVLHKPVLRYFPGNLQADPLRHIGELPAISNRPQALLTLRSLL